MLVEGPFLGIPISRIMIFWRLYWRPEFMKAPVCRLVPSWDINNEIRRKVHGKGLGSCVYVGVYKDCM